MARHHDQRASKKEKEALRRNKLAIEQQRQSQALFNLRVREVQALESIAESLYVANEEKVDAWRAKMERKAMEEKALMQAAAAGTLPNDLVKEGLCVEPPSPGDRPLVAGLTAHEKVCTSSECVGRCEEPLLP